MHNVRILISGQPPMNETFNEGQTLGELLNRLQDEGKLAVNKITTWYVGGDPVSDIHDVMLTPNVTIAGAPKVEGGNA